MKSDRPKKYFSRRETKNMTTKYYVRAWERLNDLKSSYDPDQHEAPDPEPDDEAEEEARERRRP
jgi:uncharacterized protein (UPF0305 family)